MSLNSFVPLSCFPLAYRKHPVLPRLALCLFGVIGLTLLSAPLAKAQPKPAPKEIRVAAAADLQPIMPAFASVYEQKTGIKLVVSFGSSATLATQIINGAPIDIFLAADFSFPEQIVAAGLAVQKAPVPYAKGTLVVWARKDSPVQPLTLDSLTDPRAQKIAIADELHAPYGRAAAAALTKMKLYETLKPKFVVAENIAQAGQFAESGNAQLGLLSLTLAESAHFKDIGTYAVVPPTQYPAIRQCAVVMAKSDRKAEANAFLQWILSAEIQAKLKDFGLDAVQ